MSTFTRVVLRLYDISRDQQRAQWAVGQATMRLPEAGFEETLSLAMEILGSKQ